MIKMETSTALTLSGMALTIIVSLSSMHAKTNTALALNTASQYSLSK